MNTRFSKTTIAVFSIAFSYIMLVFVNAVNSWLPDALLLNEWERLLLQIVLLLAATTGFVKVLESYIGKKFLSWVNFKTPHLNIWDDVVDYQRGTTVMVKLKDKDYGYVGRIDTMEENGDESWFALRDYNKINMDDLSVAPVQTVKDNNPCLFVLRMNDVESMELFYAKEVE